MASFCAGAGAVGYFSGYHRDYGWTGRSAGGAAMMTPILKPLRHSRHLLTGADRQPAKYRRRGGMTKELAQEGEITERDKVILPPGRPAAAIITNYFSSGVAVFAFLGTSVIIPLVVILLFKFIGANLLRIWIIEESSGIDDCVVNMFIGRTFYHRHDQPVTMFGHHGICHYSGAENYRSARLGRPYLPARDGVVGLPGEAATVLLASLMSMGGAVGVAASLATAGALSGHDVTVLLPAIYLMGNPVQNVGRCLGTAEVNAKYYRILSQSAPSMRCCRSGSCSLLFNKELSCLIYPPRVYLITGCAPVCARRPGHLRCSAREWQNYCRRR